MTGPLNWDDLPIVAAVARRGSYARAARDLGVDETTVARRVARAEAALGAPLFAAVDGARRPTPACEAALAPIAAMMREAARVEDIARAAAGQGLSGRIRIACTAGIAERALAPGLGALLAAHPGLRLDLRPADGNVDFARWEADLAIRLGRPAAGVFAVRKLGAFRMRLWRPAGGGGAVCAYPEDLSGTPEMQALAAAGLADAPRLRIANPRVIREVIASGHGVGVLPDYACGGLAELGATSTPIAARREIWLLIQPHLKDDPLARIVIDWIADRIATLCS